MKVSFSTDADGFLSQECPSCQQRFKVIFGEGSQEPISHCPYCGYKGQRCWLTQEQSNHVKAVATNIVIGPELKKLERKIKGSSKGLLKINMKSNLPKPSQPPVETDVFFDILHFPCCKETIKVNRQQKHFCIICGMEIAIAILNHLRDIVYWFSLGKWKYLFCRIPLTNRSLICSKQVVHNAWERTKDLPFNQMFSTGFSCGV